MNPTTTSSCTEYSENIKKNSKKKFPASIKSYKEKRSKFGKMRKNKITSREHLYYFFYVPLTLLYTITSIWYGRFGTPCILKS
jgi:hypothetical protein